MSRFFPPDDGGLWVTGDFAGELHHLALEFGGVLRAFENPRFSADDEARRGGFPRSDDVIGQALKRPGVFGADVGDGQIAVVLDLVKRARNLIGYMFCNTKPRRR